MAKQNDILKPCPFCGGEAQIERWGGHMSMYYYLITCNTCHVCLVTEPSVNAVEAEAIEAWNRRTYEA